MHPNYAKKNPSVRQWASKCSRSVDPLYDFYDATQSHTSRIVTSRSDVVVSGWTLEANKGALMNSRDGGMNVSDFWYVLQFRRCPSIDSPPPQPFQVTLWQSVHFYGEAGETWLPVIVNWKGMSSINETFVSILYASASVFIGWQDCLWMLGNFCS